MNVVKLIGIILIVLGIYIGVTVYTEGTDRAFGGIFAQWTEPGTQGTKPDLRSPIKRAEESVRGALDASVERVERSLERSD